MQGFFSFPGTVDSRNKSLVTDVILLAGLVAAYVSAPLVLADERKTLGLIALGFACLAFAVKILNNWRQVLYNFLAWLFIADSAREYPLFVDFDWRFVSPAQHCSIRAVCAGRSRSCEGTNCRRVGGATDISFAQGRFGRCPLASHYEV